MRLRHLTAALLAALTAWTTINSTHAQQKDIVDTAVEAGAFKTLVAAVQAAELVDALKSTGPFTVFAPTDEAFAKLPEGTVEALLKPENKDQLKTVLLYHVVPAAVPAAEVVKLRGARTLAEQRLDIKVSDQGVQVDSANVINTDIQCSNGVIHVIDSVLLPATKNLVETANNAGNFKTLLAAAKAAGLAGTLANGGPFTVFAPTDEAFARLPEGTVESLLKPENKGKLAAILKYHVVAGRVYSDDLKDNQQVETLLGKKATVRLSDVGAKIGTAKIVATDIDASNGVIHVIDSVLLPPEKEKHASTATSATGSTCSSVQSTTHVGVPQSHQTVRRFRLFRRH
ncbi:MAG: fasciclin domain-containing protein [Planctomycetota bacterium]|nr:MAG: fasciclin domain-containing protein [Planctomycetota bacterium]